MDIAVEMASTGGPDVLRAMERPPQEPGPGEIRLRHEAVGINFVDIYQRVGRYPLPLPAVLGLEGAGVVEAIGEDVDGLSVGDRVAYGGVAGAYAATRLLPAWRAVRLPNAISTRVAAATMLKGLTAHMLLTLTHPVQPGDVLLVHAAAGGLGSILTRWATHLGARVIGTAGSEAKAGIARANGAEHVIVGRDADLAGEIAKLTDGRGVDFAVDGIGGETLRKTFASVRRFGTVASIGQAGGPIPLLDVDELGPVRALTLARPSVIAYSADRSLYPTAASAVLAMMAQGVVAEAGGDYALRDAAQAHADLEAGRTTGSLLLIP